MTLASHKIIKIFSMFLVENKNLKEIVGKWQIIKNTFKGKEA